MYRSNPFCSTKTCESTCEHENAKTRKRENGRNQPVDARTAKTRKRRKRENRENGENAKTRKRRKPENDENPKTAKSVPVFWFSISRFLVFWFSRFLVFSFRWPHPSGQVAFFMCLGKPHVHAFSPCSKWILRESSPHLFDDIRFTDAVARALALFTLMFRPDNSMTIWWHPCSNFIQWNIHKQGQSSIQNPRVDFFVKDLNYISTSKQKLNFTSYQTSQDIHRNRIHCIWTRLTWFNSSTNKRDGGSWKHFGVGLQPTAHQRQSALPPWGFKSLCFWSSANVMPTNSNHVQFPIQVNPSTWERLQGHGRTKQCSFKRTNITR